MRYEGNIFRPPGEARSYLLQVTVGCSYNACAFCGMYKDKKYRVKPLEELLEDIAMARKYYGDVRKVFLCDGDAIEAPMEVLLPVLKALYDTFPSLERVTSYAGPLSTLKKSPEELRTLREAGLNRVYLGVESGDDAVLDYITKGVSAEQMLQAGIRLREAGFDLWTIVILGLAPAGEAALRHAHKTAEILNAMQPRHASAMAYMPDPGTRMAREVQQGKFRLLSAADILKEVRILVDELNVPKLHFTSNHASNYLPLKGTLPDQREEMLQAIDAALAGEIRIRSEMSRGL